MKKTGLFILVFSIVLFGLQCSKEEDETPGLSVEEQFSLDSAAIEEYLIDNNFTDAKYDEDSVIRFIVLREGTGTDTAGIGQCVRVNYAGHLFPDGEQFDADTLYSTYVTDVIYGWRIALQLLREGDSIRLFVPSGYAYGSSGAGSIPPNAILEFNMGIEHVGFTINNNTKVCE